VFFFSAGGRKFTTSGKESGEREFRSIFDSSLVIPLAVQFYSSNLPFKAISNHEFDSMRLNPSKAVDEKHNFPKSMVLFRAVQLI
jgi:hypothetical protein